MGEPKKRVKFSMSKELEALDNIRQDIVNAYVLVKGKGKYTDDDFDVIEKALKDKEEIEEKLGMPIDKFFVVLFGIPNCLSVWVVHPHKGLQKVYLDGFEYHKTRYFTAFNIDVGSVTLETNQYGKTWATTKEELE